MVAALFPGIYQEESDDKINVACVAGTVITVVFCQTTVRAGDFNLISSLSSCCSAANTTALVWLLQNSPAYPFSNAGYGKEYIMF